MEDVSAFCAANALLLRPFGTHQKMTTKRTLDCQYLSVFWFRPRSYFCSGLGFSSGFRLRSRLRLCPRIGFPRASMNIQQLTHPANYSKTSPLLCLPHLQYQNPGENDDDDDTNSSNPSSSNQSTKETTQTHHRSCCCCKLQLDAKRQLQQPALEKLKKKQLQTRVDATDAIDATMDCRAAASTTHKTKMTMMIEIFKTQPSSLNPKKEIRRIPAFRIHQNSFYS